MTEKRFSDNEFEARPPLVIYHARCMDGAAAAACAWLRFGDAAEYVAAQYGPLSKELRHKMRGGREVYVLDFSWKRDDMVDAIQNTYNAPIDLVPGIIAGEAPPSTYGGKLLVLDHHKTAQAELAGLPCCVFDMGRSGAAMAWDHFSDFLPLTESVMGEFLYSRTKGPRPRLIEYVQDRDLWRWKLPHSREISAFLQASEALDDFRALADVMHRFEIDDGPENFYASVSIGEALLRQERSLVKSIAKCAELVFVGPMRLPVMAVSSPVLQSEVGEAICERMLQTFLWPSIDGGVPYGLAAIYRRDVDTRGWIVSLRARGPADASEVAKIYGGGGHKGAAGFACQHLPWEGVGGFADDAFCPRHGRAGRPADVGGLACAMNTPACVGGAL